MWGEETGRLVDLVLQNPALAATKTSVLIFYLRLFKDTQFVLKYWSWALLGIVNLAGIILTFINVFRMAVPPSSSHHAHGY